MCALRRGPRHGLRRAHRGRRADRYDERRLGHEKARSVAPTRLAGKVAAEPRLVRAAKCGLAFIRTGRCSGRRHRVVAADGSCPSRALVVGDIHDGAAGTRPSADERSSVADRAPTGWLSGNRRGLRANLLGLADADRRSASEAQPTASVSTRARRADARCARWSHLFASGEPQCRQSAVLARSTCGERERLRPGGRRARRTRPRTLMHSNAGRFHVGWGGTQCGRRGPRAGADTAHPSRRPRSMRATSGAPRRRRVVRRRLPGRRLRASVARPLRSRRTRRRRRCRRPVEAGRRPADARALARARRPLADSTQRREMTIREARATRTPASLASSDKRVLVLNAPARSATAAKIWALRSSAPRRPRRRRHRRRRRRSSTGCATARAQKAAGTRWYACDDAAVGVERVEPRWPPRALVNMLRAGGRRRDTTKSHLAFTAKSTRRCLERAAAGAGGGGNLMISS